MKKTLLSGVSLLFVLSFIMIETAFAQSVTIDPNSTVNLIDAQSTTKGILIPRMTTTQKLAIVSPAEGMIVYDTDLMQFSYWKGGGPVLGYWQNFGNPPTIPSSVWNTNGSDIENTNGGSVVVGAMGFIPTSKLEVHSNSAHGMRIIQVGPYKGLEIQSGTINNTNPVLEVSNSTSGYGGRFSSSNPQGKGIYSILEDATNSQSAIEGITFGNGNGGYFSSNSGNALATGTGNVGIGVTIPTKAKLDVATTNPTTALFGSTSTGISLQQNWPTIGFNQYRDNDNVQKYIGDGFAMGNFMNPSNGNMYWVTNSTGNAGTTTSEETVLMGLTKEGRLGIGTSITPNSTLLAMKGTNIDGSAVFGGTTHTSHFHYSTNEDTYIRGGKNGSKVIINDGALGSVGIGISDFAFPAKLSVYQPTIESNSNTHVLHLRGQNPVQLFADQYNTTRGYIKGITNRSQTPQFTREGLEIGVAAGDLYLTANYASSITISGLNNNVGIGTYPTNNYRLSVNGTIRSKEVIVETGWADYVFDESYQLRSIAEMESFIKENKHLPNIPSATEIEKNGLKVGETNKAMMEKIEELALYIIQLKKEIDVLKSKN